MLGDNDVTADEKDQIKYGRIEQKKVYSITGLCLSGSLDKVEWCKTTETHQKNVGGKGSLVGRSGAHRWGAESIPSPHFW